MNDKKIAVIEKYPTKYNYGSLFPFPIEKYSLVNSRQDKVLKRDITLNLEELKNTYDYLILIGKEPSKFVGNISSVTEYQGHLFDNKYLCLVNPAALAIRPSLKNDFDKAIFDIVNTINGVTHTTQFSEIQGLKSENEIVKHLRYLLELIDSGEVNTIAVDTETSSLYPRNGHVLGISISYKKEQGVYLDSLEVSDSVVMLLQEIFDKTIVVFHNAKFDIKMLQYHFGFTFSNFEDTMLEHYILDETEGSHKLKPLALKFTKLGDYDRELEEYKANYCRKHGIKQKDFTYEYFPFEIIYPYAALDTAATFELHSIFRPAIYKNDKLNNVYENILKRGTLFLLKMEENGIPINLEKVKEHIININEKINELTKNLYTYKEIKEVEKVKGALFNPNSVAHKRCLFFDVLGLSSSKLTPKGELSTDAEVLESLAEQHPLVHIIQEIQQLKKIKSTYLEKFLTETDLDGRLRTNFNIHIVSSGRLSSSGKLNAQQLPKKNKAPKECIEAKKGYKIVSQDLQTAEMYIAAVLSGDKVLQKIFIDEVDYHGSMAVLKFGLNCHPNDVKNLYPTYRDSAKTISFEILYKLNYNEPALENFKKLKWWLKSKEEYIKENGYIYSFFGRKRRLKDAFSSNKQEAQHQVRSGINFLVQSVASDINLLAAIEMQDWIEKNNYINYMKIFALVHDSILAEVKDEYIELYTTKLKEITQKDRGLSIPNRPIGIDVEIGTNYAFT